MGAYKKLSMQQVCFIERLILHPGNAALAAKESGYSPARARVTASELLRKPHIKKALAEEQRKLRDSLDIEKRQLVLSLLAIADCPGTSVPDRIKAIREAGLMLGYYQIPPAASPESDSDEGGGVE